MSVGIGAAGVIGLAFESTEGEYTAPTKYTPIRTESLQWQQNTNWRRVIAGTVDPMGAVPGDGHVEGDLDSEVLEDTLPYFLNIARGDIVKTGAAAPFTYEFTPNHAATPSSTASVTIVRNNVVFGYTGVVVASMNFTIDNGQLVVTYSLLGRAEDNEADPGPAAFDDTGPFGSGTYDLQIPIGTTVKDTDNFSFQVDDNGTPENRLQDELGAAFISYGERNAQLTMERDFVNRDTYNEFKALTERSLLLRSAKSEDEYVEFEIPVSIQDSHEVAIGGVGDLIRASITYQAVHSATIGGSYKITVGTNEDVPVGS